MAPHDDLPSEGSVDPPMQLKHTSLLGLTRVANRTALRNVPSEDVPDTRHSRERVANSLQSSISIERDTATHLNPVDHTQEPLHDLTYSSSSCSSPSSVLTDSAFDSFTSSFHLSTSYRASLGSLPFTPPPPQSVIEDCFPLHYFICKLEGVACQAKRTIKKDERTPTVFSERDAELGARADADVDTSEEEEEITEAELGSFAADVGLNLLSFDGDHGAAGDVGLEEAVDKLEIAGSLEKALAFAGWTKPLGGDDGKHGKDCASWRAPKDASQRLKDLITSAMASSVV